MATAVEANSLSSITQLAANPPRYPRNPSQETRPSLVLYIARVPGSRDFFLTTIKPRQKVVSAEDVSSSLYYVHVGQPDPTAEQEGVAEQSRLGESYRVDHPSSDAPRVSRKPLPSEPSATALPPPLPKRPQSDGDAALRPEHTPDLGRDQDGLASADLCDGKATKRKPVEPEVSRQLPLGPRPQHARKRSGPSPDRAEATMLSQGMAPHRSDEDPSPLPRRRCTENVQRRPLDSPDVLLGQPCDIGTQYGGQGSNSVRGSTPRLSSSSYHRRNSSGDSSVARARGNHSVTLIRRDPTSGAQWNVARLLVSEPGSASPSRSERSLDKPPPDQEGGSRIQIDILNPGYNRFLHSSKASLQPASNLAAGAGDPNGNAAGEQGFRRQVFGGAARSRLGQSWNRRSVTRVGEGHGDTPLPESSNSNAPPARATVTQPAEADLGRASDRAFSFISPWDGTCEFSTGTSGRSLKCKHHVPSAANAEAASSAMVSELRFNLPILPLPNPFKHSPKSSGSSDLGRSFAVAPEGGFRNRLSSQVGPVLDLVHATDRLDLSLAQEKAGGGSSGKEAKLGKLIVHDEGLKMADLVVAANMGIWWKVYERRDVGRE